MLVLGLVMSALVGCDSDDGDRPKAEPSSTSAPEQPAEPPADTAAARRPVRLLRLGRFDNPTFVSAPRGDRRRFVVQRGGTIVIVRGRRTLDTPFLDVSSMVNT